MTCETRRVNDGRVGHHDGHLGGGGRGGERQGGEGGDTHGQGSL